MKKSLGFTLIELIATIVIISIVALITIPKIIDIINDAKKGSFINSSYGLIDSLKNGFTNKLLDEEAVMTVYSYTNGTETKVQGNVELEYNGAKPSSGKIVVNEYGEIAAVLYKEGLCVVKDYHNSEVVVININEEQCTFDNQIIYRDSVLNGAYPELKSGMIPIQLADDGTVTVADIYSEWYNYTNKKWANVVTVTEESRSKYVNENKTYNKGQIIPASDILTYMVWIPRYKYKLFNAGEAAIVTGTDPNKITTIELVFEKKDAFKSKGKITGQFLTHPAFTFGKTELSGIWVGKFETTGTASNPTIKPNLRAITNITPASMFVTSRNMESINNKYGFKGNEIDTHMMKNMEWGAVAYLSHSNYGINKEIRINNSSLEITGCAATNPALLDYKVYTGYYNGCQNAYNTTTGNLASTTGNITGIYDMSGGSWEYVMGIAQDDTGNKTITSGWDESINSGFNGVLGAGGSLTTGIDYPEVKYYDLYDYITEPYSVSSYSRGKLGDATKEMGSFGSYIQNNSNKIHIGSWYADVASTPVLYTQFICRGGTYLHGSGAGIFAYGAAAFSYSSYSFRVVASSE